MPRSRRVEIEGGVHHVYNRFARGERVFAEEREVRRFLRLLGEVKDRDGLTIFAWAVLGNHFHLAVRTGPAPLARSMRSLQGRFSQAFNIRSHRTGPVWQSRYQARLVDGNEYLRQLIVYVHLNPVRAGLTEEPAAYAWSGHAAMIGRRRGRLLDVDEALLVFGSTTRGARREYLSAVHAALAESGSRERRLVDMPWWAPSRELAVRQETAHVDLLGRSTGLERPRLEAPEYIRLCAELLEIAPEGLGSRRRGGELTRARELIAALGLQRWAQSSTAMAQVLGLYPDSVGRQAGRGLSRATEEPDFRRRLDELDRRLAARVGY